MTNIFEAGSPANTIHVYVHVLGSLKVRPGPARFKIGLSFKSGPINKWVRFELNGIKLEVRTEYILLLVRYEFAQKKKKRLKSMKKNI